MSKANFEKSLIKKRYVTLFEMLIALTLTIAILMTLTFFYRQVTEIGIAVDRTESQNFKTRFIETRLSTIIPKALPSSKSDFLFFSVDNDGLTKSGSQNLIFMFNNGVSLDKTFAGHVLTRIYLDKNDRLMIAYWPSPKRWESETFPMKNELLLEGVENLAFEFYIAPARKDEVSFKSDENKEKTPQPAEEGIAVEPEPKGGWRRDNWLQDYKQLPVMVKILVTLKGLEHPFVLIYPLANTKAHVIYE